MTARVSNPKLLTRPLDLGESLHANRVANTEGLAADETVLRPVLVRPMIARRTDPRLAHRVTAISSSRTTCRTTAMNAAPMSVPPNAKGGIDILEKVVHRHSQFFRERGKDVGARLLAALPPRDLRLGGAEPAPPQRSSEVCLISFPAKFFEFPVREPLHRPRMT